jgi:hypothetical protein
MRKFSQLAAAAVGAATLAVMLVPPVAANASTLASAGPVQPQPADGGHGVAVPVHLTPGTHTVSRTIPVATNARPAAGHVTPDSTTKNVSVRVGKNNCGGFQGTLEWGTAVDIYIAGTLWDSCNYYTPNTTVYLYVKYNDILGTHNDMINYVSGSSISVRYYDWTSTSPSNIWVDTCLKWNNGWGCGPAQHL